MRVDSELSSEEALELLHYFVIKGQTLGVIGFLLIILAPVIMIFMTFLWVLDADFHEQFIRMLFSVFIMGIILTVGLILTGKYLSVIKDLRSKCWNPYNLMTLMQRQVRYMLYGMILGSALMVLITHGFFWDERWENSSDTCILVGGILLILIFVPEFMFGGISKFKGYEWKSFKSPLGEILPVVDNALIALPLNFSYENVSYKQFSLPLNRFITDKFTVNAYGIDIWAVPQEDDITDVTMGPITPQNKEIVKKIQSMIDRQYTHRNEKPIKVTTTYPGSSGMDPR